MTFREMNDLFFSAWADDKGLIWGKPVALIYKMNQAAGGHDDTVDEALLAQELERCGLTLPGFTT